MPESVLIGILITATGLLIVFTLLACLYVISKILLSVDKKNVQITKNDNLILATTRPSNVDNDIPIAAIMAAVACMMESEVMENNNIYESIGFRVRTIKEIFNN